MRTRLLLVGAAVLMLQPARSIGQSFVAHSATAPVLAPGQKVRVWTLEQATFLGLPTPRLQALRFVGTLTAYNPPDSLSLRRTALFVAPWRSREYTARWESVRRIDVPHGRDAVGGTLAGVSAAIGYGLFISFFERVFCDAQSCGRGVLTYGARAAVVTVPAGALAGIFTTRWKRAYWGGTLTRR